MAKKVTGSSSGLYTRLNQREMNFLDMYVQYREGETGDWVPDWFYEKYDGQIRAMSPVVLTYFVAELVGKNQPYQLYPGYRSGPLLLREGGYDKETRRSISHIETGTAPIPFGPPEGDPDPWATYTQDKRYFQEAQRIYYKLLGKMRRRRSDDVEECDMHAKTHLDEGDYEDHALWKAAELEGKNREDAFGLWQWKRMEDEMKREEESRREITHRRYQNPDDPLVAHYIKKVQESMGYYDPPSNI